MTMTSGKITSTSGDGVWMTNIPIDFYVDAGDGRQDIITKLRESLKTRLADHDAPPKIGGTICWDDGSWIRLSVHRSSGNTTSRYIYETPLWKVCELPDGFYQGETPLFQAPTVRTRNPEEARQWITEQVRRFLAENGYQPTHPEHDQ